MFGNSEAAQFHLWEYTRIKGTRHLYWILTGPSFAVRFGMGIYKPQAQGGGGGNDV